MELVHDSSHFTLKICHLPLEECVCTLKIFKLDLLHLKGFLGHSNHSNKIYFTSNMPYTLKYLKSDLLHLQRSNTLKSFNHNFFHLKGALHSQIKFSPPHEKS